MKKTFLWLFQFAATAALLWWVFHDPAKQRTLKDAVTGRDILARPRQNLEVLQELLYAQDPVFGSGNSLSLQVNSSSVN